VRRAQLLPNTQPVRTRPSWTRKTKHYSSILQAAAAAGSDDTTDTITINGPGPVGPRSRPPSRGFAGRRAPTVNMFVPPHLSLSISRPFFMSETIYLPFLPSCDLQMTHFFCFEFYRSDKLPERRGRNIARGATRIHREFLRRGAQRRTKPAALSDQTATMRRRDI